MWPLRNLFPCSSAPRKFRLWNYFVLVLLVLLSTFPTMAQSTKSATGEWSTQAFPMSSRCVHISLLKGVGTNHSRIVWWPEENNTTAARIWDWMPTDTSAPAMPASFSIATNLFCAGHSVLPTGDILTTGGTERGDVGIRETNIFGRTTMAWTTAEDMEYDRWYPTNTTLGNGDVFISAGHEQPDLIAFGGHNGSGLVDSTHLLAMRTDLAWNEPSYAPGPRPGARNFHSSIDMGVAWKDDGCSQDDNRFATLIYGGESQTGLYNDLWGLRWNYTDDTYTWQNITGLTGSPGPLCRHTAVYDTLGHDMYIYGGIRGVDNFSSTLYRLNGIHPPGSNCTSALSWETVDAGPGPPALYGHNAIYDAAHRRMIVFGGRNTIYYNDVWLLNLEGVPTWEGPLVLDTTEVPEPRAGAYAVFDTTNHDAADYSYTNNRLLVFGGFTGPNNALTPVPNTLWSGTIIENTVPKRIRWRAIPLAVGAAVCPPIATEVVLNNLVSELPTPRADGSMVLEDEPYYRVLVFGGDTNGGLPGGATNEVWELQLGPSTCGYGYLHWEKRNPAGANPPGARVGGSVIFDTRPRTALEPEIFRVVTKTLDEVENGQKWLYSYPFMHLLPNGEIFYSGADTRTAVFNFSSGWDPPIMAPFSGDTSVQIPITGGTQVMKCGQKVAPVSLAKLVGTILLNPSGEGSWTLADASAQLLDNRQDANLTILPDGRVLLSGGVDTFFPDPGSQDGRRKPLIWDPGSREWNAHDGNNLEALADCPNIRDYHSVAMLLPDGSVLSAGGEDIKTYGDNNLPDGPERRMTGEIYKPPYLFTGDNPAVPPVIACADEVIGYGLPFNLTVNGTNPIGFLSLVRPSSVTHGFNFEQRFVKLSSASTLVSGNQSILGQGPVDGNAAPPGYYLLFALSPTGVPSIAQWVQVGPSHSGTLSADEIWYPEQGPHVISGDLVVPAGKTLELKPGVVVGMAQTSPTARITVLGTLKILGTASNRIKIGTGGCSPQEGRWEGIIVEPGGALTVQHADVGYAVNGIRVTGLVSQIISVTNTNFASNSLCDVILDRAPTPGSNALLTFSSNTMTVTSGSGVRLTGMMTGATISGNIFTGTGGSGGSTSGLIVNNNGEASSPLITGNVFTGFGSGHGLKLEGGSASVRGNTFTACKWGAYITGGSHQFVPVPYATGPYNTFSNNTNSGVHMTGGGVTPYFRRNLFTDNYNGAVNQLGAQPNFGDAGGGDNSFINTTSKCVWNRPVNPPNPPVAVSAENNYWGSECIPPFVPACAVNVDASPCLSTSPLGSSGPRVQTEPTPQPENALVCRSGSVVTAVASFEVTPRDGIGWSEIRVYDVLGRLRATIPLAGSGDAVEDVNWSPRDTRGQRLPAGLYFATARNEQMETRAVRLVVMEGGSGR